MSHSHSQCTPNTTMRVRCEASEEGDRAAEQRARRAFKVAKHLTHGISGHGPPFALPRCRPLECQRVEERRDRCSVAQRASKILLHAPM